MKVQVLLFIESMLRMLNYFNMHAFVVSGLKIIGRGNPNNNLESLCILFCTLQRITEELGIELPLLTQTL
jgi:hypothetical protein